LLFGRRSGGQPGRYDPGGEHRLEIIRQRDGVMWVNDSIATAPERTAAALRSFAEPIILLAGGRDKKLPWDECAAAIYEAGSNGFQHVRHVLLFGEAAGLIGKALAHYAQESGLRPVPTTHCADLEEAVAAASKLAAPGDIVLLAPGGTSFDAYQDFTARGQHFRALVEALP
jgi:UDP-N-acetylmuramoylalanine--D-glutamate ligase